MAMPNTLAGWTVPDLYRLPEDGNTYELVHGELFVTPAPSVPHQELVSALTEVLFPYVAMHRIGRLHFPHSVVRVGSHSQVEPDLMVRPITARRATSWDTAPRPILVVEVTSGTTARRDRIQKRSLYLDAGIPEYWIVDREHRTITVVRPGSDDAELPGELVWHPAGAAERLTIDVRRLFADALGTREAWLDRSSDAPG